MRQTIVGSCVGLVLAVSGCTGTPEGDAPGDVVQVKSQLEAAVVESDISTAIDSGLAGKDVSTAVSAEVSSEINTVQSLFEDVALNPFGVATTSHLSGGIDRTNPFFESMGTNGRSCESCHDARAAWTTSALLNKLLFELTAGTHPIFASLHDSGNRPDAPFGTLSEKRAAFKTLLDFGVHRFTRTGHVGLDYDVTAVDDPWGWSTVGSFANFRRPGTNMGNVNRVASTTTTGTPTTTIRAQLEATMNGATLFHAQTTVPVPEEKRVAGADFMLGLSFAQLIDFGAGRLDVAGARGGATNLAAEPYPVVGPFDLYTAWTDACGDGPGVKPWCSSRNRKREQIARGQELFNNRQFQVSGVAGLNDELGIPVLTTTCSGCHRAKNVGSSTSIRFMDIGVAAESNRAAFLPLLTVQNRTTGEIRKTTDLGRALNTRLWADIGKVRVLGLRGLASRAPYFHAGQAANIGQVLSFYNQRFAIGLTSAQRADLEAFLLAL
jgi:cytochrome c peroxidase